MFFAMYTFVLLTRLKTEISDIFPMLLLQVSVGMTAEEASKQFKAGVFVLAIFFFGKGAEKGGMIFLMWIFF